MGLVIAIDGYSGCGKSTLAKALASRLGYRYIDTGAMYRAVCWYALQQGFFDNRVLNQSALIQALTEISIQFKYNPQHQASEVFLNGENCETSIRTMEISSLVTQVSKLPEVRKKMVELQRRMGAEKSLVMDGRDIGSYVFPEAELKLFMTADKEVRAQRRLLEHQLKGESVSLKEVMDNLEYRDFEDRTRSESPLIQTADAFVVDTTLISKDEQLNLVLTELKRRSLL